MDCIRHSPVCRACQAIFRVTAASRRSPSRRRLKGAVYRARWYDNRCRKVRLFDFVQSEMGVRWFILLTIIAVLWVINWFQKLYRAEEQPGRLVPK